MKKRIYLLSLILLGAAAASAAAPVVIEKGIILGLNLSNFSGQELDVDWKTKAGFAGSLTLTVAWNDYLALQTGLTYAQRGARYEEPYDQGTLRTTMNLSYLDIPFLARVSFPLGSEKAFRFYVLGGSSYSFQLKAMIRSVYLEVYETPVGEGEVEGLKKSYPNLVLGGGFDFAIQEGRLLVEARYSRSFSTISTEGPDIRLNVISILFGYSF